MDSLIDKGRALADELFSWAARGGHGAKVTDATTINELCAKLTCLTADNAAKDQRIADLEGAVERAAAWIARDVPIGTTSATAMLGTLRTTLNATPKEG